MVNCFPRYLKWWHGKRVTHVVYLAGACIAALWLRNFTNSIHHRVHSTDFLVSRSKKHRLLLVYLATGKIFAKNISERARVPSEHR